MRSKTLFQLFCQQHKIIFIGWLTSAAMKLQLILILKWTPICPLILNMKHWFARMYHIESNSPLCWILPIQVETIKFVAQYEIGCTFDKSLASFSIAWHSWIVRRTFIPPTDSQRYLWLIQRKRFLFVFYSISFHLSAVKCQQCY